MARRVQVIRGSPSPTGKAHPGTRNMTFYLEQQTPIRIALDERDTWFYEAVASTKGMLIRQLVSARYR